MNATSESVLRVLIVDDDKDTLRVSRELVEKAASTARVTTARGAADAMAHLRKASNPGAEGEPLPTIILLDLDMPLMNGFDLLRWVRRNRSLATTKVVMLSSSGSRADIKRAEELGADGYLVKYPTIHDLVALFTGTPGKCCWPSEMEPGERK